VHIILYDDFRHDTAAVYAGACRFLGVDPDFRPDFPVLNANKQVKNRALQFFLNNPSPTVLWLARHSIPTRLRHWLVDRLKQFNSRRAPREEIPAELRLRLAEEFRDEVASLGRLVGRDLSSWCGETASRAGRVTE
jgi:hypothetical protein